MQPQEKKTLDITSKLEIHFNFWLRNLDRNEWANITNPALGKSSGALLHLNVLFTIVKVWLSQYNGAALSSAT